MLQDNLNNLIMESMKNHDDVRTRTLRFIKAAITEARTAKGAGVIDEAKEIQILQKMLKQREDSCQQYIDANRPELAKDESDEIEVIKGFLPKAPTSEEIQKCFENLIATGLTPSKANMGVFIKNIKAKYPAADGKIVSEIVKNGLN